MLEQGLLWFDSSPNRTLEQKVQRAVDHYAAKFGRQPTVCYINKRSVPEREQGTVTAFQMLVGSVQVSVLPSVLPNHFWLGEEEGDGSVSV